ncbi:response regulator [Zobellia alginiliquefaciens]|uniref:response regulator n=1 Tax=Zobellia alginiliquefaciens TaxID=3032586 RepID=UPI0023E384FF|nr:response regulator [Zobellia alginiliquefaciens]
MKDKVFNIFLTDDDADDRMLFEEALLELDIQVEFRSFENGVDLMKNLLDPIQPLPDYIFLDLNMPLMNGEECLNDIRDEPKFSKIPIIIYSTFIDSIKLEVLRLNGANLYLKKPNSFSLLKRAIEDCIANIKTQSKEPIPPSDFILQY